MPLYDFVCSCGEKFTEFRHIREMSCSVRLPCPACGKPCEQVFSSVAVRGNYKKPVRLESMGFLADPEDVAEHRRRFPNVELHMENGSAVPVVKSLGEKRAYLKASGWVDTKSFT